MGLVCWCSKLRYLFKKQLPVRYPVALRKQVPLYPTRPVLDTVLIAVAGAFMVLSNLPVSKTLIVLEFDHKVVLFA